MILLRLFKNNRSGGMATVFLLSIALFIKSFIQPIQITGFEAMPFYNLVFGSIHTVPVLNHIVAIIFLMIIGYMLIRIGVRYVLLSFRSFMPALFFLLFSMALPSAQQVSPALVGSVFYLFCFAILFDVPDKRPDSFIIFTAGIILALGSMFYLKLIWFVPLIWISLATLRSVTWREMVYPVIAYFLLGLFLFTWYWTVLDNAAGFIELISKNLAFENSLNPYHFSVTIYYGFFILMVGVASLHMANRFQALKTVVQSIYQVLFYMFVGGILFFTLIARFDPASLVIIAFPVSFILSDFFHRKRNPWSHELILWILIGLLVFVQWMV